MGDLVLPTRHSFSITFSVSSPLQPFNASRQFSQSPSLVVWVGNKSFVIFSIKIKSALIVFTKTVSILGHDLVQSIANKSRHKYTNFADNGQDATIETLSNLQDSIRLDIGLPVG
jgi:hypothetical protein